MGSSTKIRVDSEKEAENKIWFSYATIDDIDLLVALHFKCFNAKDHIIIKFGKPFVLASFRWFITSPKAFVVIAKQGDHLIGYQTVSEGPYNVPMFLAGWREALLRLIFRPWLVFHPELLRRIGILLFHREKATLESNKIGHLAFIGVDSQFRGMGIGKALVIASIRACRERGMSAIITGVLKQNKNSISMLESAGLVKVPELKTNRYVQLKIDLDQDDQFTFGLSEKVIEQTIDLNPVIKPFNN